jgi:hypothetical protein
MGFDKGLKSIEYAPCLLLDHTVCDTIDGRLIDQEAKIAYKQKGFIYWNLCHIRVTRMLKVVHPFIPEVSLATATADCHCSRPGRL